MRRTIENLRSQREKKEKEFRHSLEKLGKLNKELVSLFDSERIRDLISELEKQTGSLPPAAGGSIQILTEFHKALENYRHFSEKMLSAFNDLMQQNAALMDAKDKEWDALGSNHVSMIFKSMEWKIESLSALYQDASILIKKFLLLKEKLTRLAENLERKTPPPASLVNELIKPLEDWRYASFENRYRGTDEEVKRQLERYLPYFQTEKKVVDLGCGRGEFLGLLAEKGIEAEGVDSNEQMIDACLDKGLLCHRGDILEKLAGYEEGSLGGIFSSQVVEHLSPDYLKRMIELSYFKLVSSGHIVLETINPTSVFTLVHVYYLDLSHQQPVHPQALQFLLTTSGFEDVHIEYSAHIETEKLESIPPSLEGADAWNRNVDKLNDLLFSAANYAAIGIKK